MNHTMSNFFHEFAAAAQAMEELPKVREDLSEANSLITALRETIQRLELQAIDRRTEMETLHSRIRSLEVERDEAQFQALEEQDRTSAFKRFVEGIFGQAGNLLQASAPVATPEPAPLPEPVSEASGERAADPIPQQNPNTSASQDGSTATDVPTADASTEPSSGQSEAGPTASDGADAGNSGSVIASAPVNTSNPEGVSVPSDPTHGQKETSFDPVSPPSTQPDPLYLGKLYKDIPNYVPLHEWLAGGGTEADYYAR